MFDGRLNIQINWIGLSEKNLNHRYDHIYFEF
jgi:hypothetical protein